jgi:rhomboid protease GluP
MSEEPRRPRHPLEGPSPEEEAQEAAQPPMRRIAFALETRTPYLTYGIIGICIVVYFASQLLPTLYENGALYAPYVLGEFQLHRLVTVMFLHANIAHLLLNMVSLYTLGREIELLYGPYRFLAIYFLGGITGSILSAGIGDYGIPSVGASGAVLAVWGAQLVFLYLNRQLFGRDRIRQVLVQYGFYLIAFMVLGFLPGSRIDNWAHIGGFFGGIAVAYLMPVRLGVKKTLSPDQNIEVVVADTNRWSTAMIPTLFMIGVGLLSLLTLAIMGYRLPLFPTSF